MRCPGQDAPIRAAMRTDESLDAGDLEGRAVWLRVQALHLAPPGRGVSTYPKLTAGLIRISTVRCGRAATMLAPWVASTTAVGWPAILRRKIPYHP